MSIDELIELPKGWAITTIGDVVEVFDNRRVPLNATEREKIKGSYPYYGANGQVDSINDYLFDGDYVLVAEDGGYFDNLTKGVAYRVTGKFWVNNHAHIISPLGNISTQLFVYCLNTLNWMQYVSGTTRLKLTQASLIKVPILLPPLNEQCRIVAKIEALKARSQRVKQALEDIPQLLDQFRQSVLAAAFRGDLTADWREQNSNVEPASVLLERIRAERRHRWEEAELEKMKASGKLPKDNKWKEKYIEPEPIDISNLLELPQGWKWATMDEIADIDLGKMLDRGKEQRGKFLPYLRNINVRWGYFDLSDLLEMDFVEDEIERFSLKKDDILVCEGGQPGRAAVWELDKSDIKYQKTLHRVRPFCKIHPFWFVYHLKLDATTGRLENYFSGSTIKHFTKVAFQRYAVRLTSIEEQKEIILRIHSLFKTADVIQQQYQEIKANLDQLDQSILAKAFRGELVPQDPNDEPASVLLERIRAERDKLQTKAVKKSTPQTGGRRSKKASPQEAEPVQLELGLE